MKDIHILNLNKNKRGIDAPGVCEQVWFDHQNARKCITHMVQSRCKSSMLTELVRDRYELRNVNNRDSGIQVTLGRRRLNAYYPAQNRKRYK